MEIRTVKELLQKNEYNENVLAVDGDKFITYSNADRLATEVSRNFIDPVCQSNNVILFLDNSIDYIIGYFSILYSDKIVVPIHSDSTSFEVFSLMKYCEADMIISNSKSTDFLIKDSDLYDYSFTIFNIEMMINHIVNSENVLIEKTDFDINDVVLMLGTSGTTSLPKRVMLTNRNLISNIKSNAQSFSLCSQDVTLILLPLCFGYANTSQMLSHMYVGGKIIFTDKILTPTLLSELVSTYAVTNFTCVPSLLSIFTRIRQSKLEKFNSLRFISFGGSLVDETHLLLLMDLLPLVDFVQTYGQTEAAPRVTTNFFKSGFVDIHDLGTPINGVKVIIVNEELERVDNNIVGEILVQGQNVMKGYYKKNGETEKTIVDGWLRTGDYGYLSECNHLYFSGRKKNVIIFGGLKIYPEEVEEIILMYKGVLECRVIKRKDRYLGEIPVAEVVYEKKINEQELYKHCMFFLSKYKIPKKFIQINKIPRTYNGKIIRI